MKNYLLFGFTLGLGMVLALPASANSGQPAPNLKLDAQNISNASKVVARNRELFRDTEKLQTLIRLSKGLQKDK
ncbi:MAG: hypothetical protein K8I00_08770 [Candidatus Omnitrophica bacterium]|nr:hypothetical protein [Candidatus Omnitrophota bacterium]